VVFPLPFRASDEGDPLIFPFFDFLAANCLSGLSAEAIFPWGSVEICAVVEQAQSNRTAMRQKPHFIDGIPVILSWLMRCLATNPYGF
jgi:hypothetical protein